MREIQIAAILGFLSLSLVLGEANSLSPSAQTLPSVTIALGNVREIYHIPIGFEIADADRDPVILDLSDKDVGHIFDSIVVQRPGYIWNLQDGVYDIFPRQRSESLSELTIANFVLINATLEEVQESLFNLPEVKNWFSLHHARRNEARGGSILGPGPGGPFPEPTRVSITLSNVQLRTILNQVIGKFDRAQWTIGHLATKGEYAQSVSIEF
jgi:hypothetical protein